jgi:hypothetical protein
MTAAGMAQLHEHVPEHCWIACSINVLTDFSRIIRVPIEVRNDLPNMREGRIGGRHTGVDRYLHQHLFEFIARKAALSQSDTRVQGKFFPAPETRRDCDHEQTARALIEARAAPHIVPGDACNHFLEIRIERGALG